LPGRPGLKSSKRPMGRCGTTISCYKSDEIHFKAESAKLAEFYYFSPLSLRALR
jgi:hypothetical protein